MKKKFEGNTELGTRDVLLANQLFYKSQASHYDAKNHVHNPAILRYYKKLIAKHVIGDRQEPGGAVWRVLDVGCGTGFMEQFFQGVVTRTYAADATFNMLAIGKNKYSTDNVSWVNADASQLPFQRESFDMVCSNAVLHHVYDYSNILREMVSLLRPGGRLFIGYEPNAIAYRLFYPVLMFWLALSPKGVTKRESRN